MYPPVNILYKEGNLSNRCRLLKKLADGSVIWSISHRISVRIHQLTVITILQLADSKASRTSTLSTSAPQANSRTRLLGILGEAVRDRVDKYVHNFSSCDIISMRPVFNPGAPAICQPSNSAKL